MDELPWNRKETSMSNTKLVAKFAFVFSVLLLLGSKAVAGEGPGVLRAEFVYEDELNENALTKGKCQPRQDKSGLSGIAVDAAVGLVGKLSESIIDAAAAKTQAEATTLEVVAPIEGFYGSDEKSVIHYGCLVIHNGVVGAIEKATILAIFQAVVSGDGTAFRFNVVEWKFARFLRPKTSQWLQNSARRDLAFKIEFLTPGSEGLGRRAVFVEHAFIAVEKEALANAFEKGQKLPWFAAPSAEKGSILPLNVRVTVVETTRPNQFAAWLQDIAKNKKSDVINLVQDSARRSLDPNFAASQDAQSATLAGTAYAAYKGAWDLYAAQVANKPSDPPPDASAAQRAAHVAELAAWQAGVTVNMQLTNAKRVSAKVAFSAASLPWPGDLPQIEK